MLERAGDEATPRSRAIPRWRREDKQFKGPFWAPITHFLSNRRAGGLYAAYATLGHAHLLLGEHDDAVAALERSLAISIESRVNLLMRVSTLASLARARLGLGEGRAALETAREATALGDRVKSRAYACDAHLALACVLRESAAPAAEREIRASLQRAETLIRQTGANAYTPVVLEERARLARLLGDEAAWRRDLSEAQRVFAQLGAVPQAERLAGELG